MHISLMLSADPLTMYICPFLLFENVSVTWLASSASFTLNICQNSNTNNFDTTAIKKAGKFYIKVRFEMTGYVTEEYVKACSTRYSNIAEHDVNPGFLFSPTSQNKLVCFSRDDIDRMRIWINIFDLLQACTHQNSEHTSFYLCSTHQHNAGMPTTTVCINIHGGAGNLKI